MAGRRARARRILADVETALTTAPEQAAYERLLELLRGGNITVLSGAGLSTESGIPDYRGPDGKRRVTPMTYGEFVASPANRQRYWARSFVGWRRFAGAGPMTYTARLRIFNAWAWFGRS